MNELTQQSLRNMFEYKAGGLYYRFTRGRVKTGDIAGTIHKSGYRRVAIDGKVYQAHRLIFLYHHGYLPKFIDHIDGNRDNNDINNLREATHQQNHMNRKKTAVINSKPTSSKFKGVSWKKQVRKWRSEIKIDGRKKHLGYFDSETEASKAYDNAAIESFGEFARLNNALEDVYLHLDDEETDSELESGGMLDV